MMYDVRCVMYDVCMCIRYIDRNGRQVYLTTTVKPTGRIGQ